MQHRMSLAFPEEVSKYLLCIFLYELKSIISSFFRKHNNFTQYNSSDKPLWLLFTSFTAAYAQKSQNSDFAHGCLGFITQKQRENISRRQRVNSNNCYDFLHLWENNDCNIFLQNL